MTGGPEAEGGSTWSTGRGPLWLPLLQRLTETVPDWVVLKNPDSAFDGVGDVDTMAPPERWPTIESTFRAWALEHDLSVLGVCRHNRRGPNLVARRPGDPYLFILDAKTHRTWRGSTLVSVGSALTLATTDAHGYRRVRTGAGGTIKLLFNGTTYGGEINEEGMRVKRVRQELRADPSGAIAATRLVGHAAPALRRAVRAATDGGWSRSDMLAVEAWCLARSLARPGVLAHQLQARATLADRCPSLRLSYRQYRRLPDDPTAWLVEFALAHRDSSFLGLRDGPATT